MRATLVGALEVSCILRICPERVRRRRSIASIRKCPIQCLPPIWTEKKNISYRPTMCSPRYSVEAGLPFVLLVNLTAVRDMHYGYGFGFHVDGVQHAPIADSNAPLIFEPSSFLHFVGRGLSASARILRSIRLNTVSSSASSSFCAACLISRVCLTTRGGRFQALVAVLAVRDSLFFPA